MKNPKVFLPRKLAIGLSITAAALSMQACAAGFSKTAAYTPGQFTDVPASEWYASEVASAFELGLMNGTGAGLFDPEGQVTVAEAITMASRAAAIYAGETIDTASSGEWYTPYVNYAVSKGFVKEGQFDSYDRPAKRREVAVIFENAMPAGYFTAKNDVSAIPDVSEIRDYHDDLLTLYKAGVVMGSDAYGNFRPEDNITRAESAAIINRVALPENRLAKSLDKISRDDAYLLIYNTLYSGSKEGINSGWVLDARGSLPRTSIEGGYGSLSDISKTEGTQMIREFNKTTTGLVNLETTVSLGSGFDGFSLEYRNDADKPVYKLETIDGAWKLLQADGSYKTLMENAKDQTLFTFNITVDLDNNRSTTIINTKDYGTYPLVTSGADSNLLNFRFATTDESTAVATLGPIKTTVNYAVYDEFYYNSDGKNPPMGWVGEGAVAGSQQLRITNGYAARYFNPISGNANADIEFNLTKGQAISYALKSGLKNVVTFSSDDKNFYANGEKIYENYVQNLWYRIRLQADADTQKATVWLNGRKIATVDYAEAATSVDNIFVTNTDEQTVIFDNVRVFEKIKRDDYVPAPVKPKGEEDHIVGMNICSLWRNGTHFGWSCISPYEDAELALGYYDEGNTETADWEIKYMVEHGIDFQAFCWYADNSNAPLYHLNNSMHLHDGYLYADYSDAMKYCLIWECANAARPQNFDAWKNYYVPYLMENYFKDSRYMSIDNQLVLAVFGANKLSEQLGGASKVKECFDYLEEEVKKLGYDGMIYLSCGSSSDSLASMGFDGAYAYNWGNQGYKLDVNKNSILNSQKASSKMYTVPTISVGFNSIPWHGIRYPMMSVDDFKTAHTWIRDEYLPTYAAKGTWQEKFSMISTWNEYGEGTYIMPSKGNGGFGYLDALREVYTDEKVDKSLDLYPTDAQRTRINRLYPQYRHLLRKTGYYDFSVDTSNLESVYTITYTENKAMGVGNTKTYEFTPEGLKGMVDGDTLIIAAALNVPAEANQVKVTIDVPKGTYVELYYVTDSDKNWTGSKSSGFTADKEGLNEYLVDMSQKSAWKGTITQFRVDPGQTEPGMGDPEKNYFRLVSVEFLKAPSKGSRNIFINGKKYELQLYPEAAANGDYLVSFDPAVALNYLLNSFYTWDRDAGVLTIEANKHTVVYTTGSDKYTVDGKTKDLGYKMYLQDGLPMIPIVKFCEDVGYKASVNENKEAVIETNQKEYFDMIAKREPAKWEFNTPGDNESWSSGHMNLFTVDGYMRATSITDSRDPIITFNGDTNFVAAKYKTFEIRVRYKHDSESPQALTMYFTTDSEPSMREAVTLKLPLKSNDSKGEWETYTYDLSKCEFWTGTIKKLRFDPFNAVGTIDIDYMRFVEDPDYNPSAKPPKEEQDSGVFEIKNGDAEGTIQAFRSDNAKISIVEDPDNKDNHVYLVKGNAGKNWSYFRYLCIFKPGKTYKVEYDVRLLGKGEDISGEDGDCATSIICNMRYSDSQGKTDHISGANDDASMGVSLKVSDGWKHVSFEYTIDENSTLRDNDQVAVYANPVGEESANYYIDNVVVTELE